MTDDTPDLDPVDRAVAEQLLRERPSPPENFRRTLARRLAGLDPGHGPRPTDLWVRVLILMLIGSLLLIVGAARAVARVQHRTPSLAIRHQHALSTVKAQRALSIGFSLSEPQLDSGDGATTAFWDPLARTAGTQIVRVAVTWSGIAPIAPPSGFVASDPNSAGYYWTGLDERIRELAQGGFKVMLTIDGAPKWAEGPNMPSNATPGTWEPSALDFGQFSTAIATRYDGRTSDPDHPGAVLPKVSIWQGWNEPNLNLYLAPQWVANGQRGYAPESPGLYRTLLNAFYGAVKAVSPSNFVVAAGTAPYGDPPGGTRMPPVWFDQYLYCLNTSNRVVGCSNPAHFDAVDHHPYGVGGPSWHAFNSYDVAVPDIGKLTTPLRIAERAHTVAPVGPKSVWVTEMSWNTNPPNPGGIPLSEQAAWAEESLHELWTEGVSTVLWFQLADLPTGEYQSGVYYAGGGVKPSRDAFRFPLIGWRTRPSEIELWGRAPKSGVLTIRAGTNATHAAMSFRVTAGEVFQFGLPVKGATTLRASVGGLSSLPWSQTR